MTTREEALNYGLGFKDVYQDAPFHDENWILVRCKKNKKAFLWTYAYQGQMRINVNELLCFPIVDKCRRLSGGGRCRD